MAKKLKKDEIVNVLVGLPRWLAQRLMNDAAELGMSRTAYIRQILNVGIKTGDKMEEVGLFDDLINDEFIEAIAQKVADANTGRGKIVKTTPCYIHYENGTKVRVGRKKAVKQKPK